MTEKFRVRVARRDITSEVLFANWVDWKNPASYPGVLDPLSVFALAVESGGKRAMLIVCDLVQPRQRGVNRFRRNLAGELADTASGRRSYAAYSYCMHVGCFATNRGEAPEAYHDFIQRFTKCPLLVPFGFPFKRVPRFS